MGSRRVSENPGLWALGHTPVLVEDFLCCFGLSPKQDISESLLSPPVSSLLLGAFFGEVVVKTIIVITDIWYSCHPCPKPEAWPPPFLPPTGFWGQRAEVWGIKKMYKTKSKELDSKEKTPLPPRLVLTPMLRSWCWGEGRGRIGRKLLDWSGKTDPQRTPTDFVRKDRDKSFQFNSFHSWKASN